MPGDGIKWQKKESLLTFEEIERISRIFVSLGVEKIRLTGGEPLLRNNLPSLAKNLSSIDGLKCLSMTTNAMLLDKHVLALKKAGVSHLNISLDSLKKERFAEITGKDSFHTVINGIDKALQTGFTSIKINMVVIDGVNDDEILDFLEYFENQNVNVRLIEFMPFKSNEWKVDKVVTFRQMLKTIEEKYELVKLDTEPSSVAKDFLVKNKNMSVSFVTSMSESFCSTCSRVRLTSDGSIKSCLFHPAEVNIRDAIRQGRSDRELENLIQYAISQKPKEHLPAEEIASEENRSMIQIGVRQMKDIGHKTTTARKAKARSILKLTENTVNMIKSGSIPKGNPLEVAKIAGIQAAKNTWQIIPYCHQLPIDFVGVEFTLETDSITIDTTVSAIHKTGVEMEAMTAASVAALTIYDMVKFLDDLAELESVKLVSKSGGKSDFANAQANNIFAATIVMSDRIHAGETQDKSGKLIKERLEEHGIKNKIFEVLPDEENLLSKTIANLCDRKDIDLILVTGGTGIGPRDRTPEALLPLFDMPLPGISEAIRAYGQDRLPTSMLSRAVAGVRNNTVIISMPGSTGGVSDSLNVVLPNILHSFKILKGDGHKKQENNLQVSGT